MKGSAYLDKIWNRIIEGMLQLLAVEVNALKKKKKKKKGNRKEDMQEYSEAYCSLSLQNKIKSLTL